MKQIAHTYFFSKLFIGLTKYIDTVNPQLYALLVNKYFMEFVVLQTRG